jgi:hypothetical protein
MKFEQLGSHAVERTQSERNSCGQTAIILIAFNYTKSKDRVVKIRDDTILPLGRRMLYVINVVKALKSVRYRRRIRFG